MLAIPVVWKVTDVDGDEALQPFRIRVEYPEPLPPGNFQSTWFNNREIRATLALSSNADSARVDGYEIDFSSVSTSDWSPFDSVDIEPTRVVALSRTGRPCAWNDTRSTCSLCLKRLRQEERLRHTNSACARCSRASANIRCSR